MSKTFKALLRAAHERASRRPHGRKQKVEPSGPPSIKRLEVAASDAVQADSPAEAKPTSVPTPQVAPVSEAEEIVPVTVDLPMGDPDPELQEILELEMMVSANGGTLDNNGWMRGHLDRKLAKRLLERYGLLHVLMQDDRNWFWFWASSTDAVATAERYDMRLDLEDAPSD